METVSLIVEVEPEDIYNDMYEHKEDYDYSEYPENSQYPNKENQIVVGKLKDEFKGAAVIEVCAMRQKAYSDLSASDKEVNKAKSVQNSVIINIFILTCIKSVFFIYNNFDMSKHLLGATVIKWKYKQTLKALFG